MPLFSLSSLEGRAGVPTKYIHTFDKAAVGSTTDLGEFRAIAADWAIDRQNDRFEVSAFTTSIEAWRGVGKRLPLLWDHKGGAEHVVGSVDPEQIRATERGLEVAGKVDLSTEQGRRAWEAVKSGALGLSLGFLAGRRAKDEKSGANILDEIDILEISLTPKPAQPGTRVLEWKSMPEADGKAVGPAARGNLENLIEYYRKKPHPFTACVRDNRKRFGDRAEAVCARLKDIMMGTTKWRNQGKAVDGDSETDWCQLLYDDAGGDLEGLLEMWHADMARDGKSLPGAAGVRDDQEIRLASLVEASPEPPSAEPEPAPPPEPPPPDADDLRKRVEQLERDRRELDMAKKEAALPDVQPVEVPPEPGPELRPVPSLEELRKAVDVLEVEQRKAETDARIAALPDTSRAATLAERLRDYEETLVALERFDPEELKAVQQGSLKAVWTAAYVNSLSDSSFLYVEPGDKDATGRTTPRSKRHFPYKDADGKVDMPHLRNALARIPQSNLPQAVKDRVTARARRILEGQKSEETGRGPSGPRSVDPHRRLDELMMEVHLDDVPRRKPSEEKKSEPKPPSHAELVAKFRAQHLETLLAGVPQDEASGA